MKKNVTPDRRVEQSGRGPDRHAPVGASTVAVVAGTQGVAPESGTYPTRVADTVPEEVIERIILQLNGICKTATLNFAFCVGQLIIGNWYAGDLERWRARNPHKDYSLRKLAKHPSLPMSPAALYRSVAIFELCERLGIRSWKHVSTTHVRVVLPLPLEDQARLLRAAEANRWSARRLEDEAAALMRCDPSTCTNRGGRKRGSRLKGAIRKFGEIVTNLSRLVGSDEDIITEASPDSARAAIELLRDAAQKCAVLEHRLESSLAVAPVPEE